MARRDKREKRDPYGMQEDYRREPERYRQDQGGYDRRYDQGYDPRYGQNYRQDEYGRNGAYRQEYRQDEYGRQGGYRQDYRGGYDNGYYEPDDRRRRAARRKKKKHITFAIEILVLVLLAAGLFVAAKVGKIKRTDVSKGDIVINSDVDLKGYTNIALFGVDSREGSLDKDAHSDAILVASINNKTKDVKLVSVYRDTYLDNTNGEYRKATECYYFGGPSRAISMLNKNLDLDITDFVTVDFTAVADVVDALGGIDIDVQEDEIVHLNNYQVEGSQVTGKEIVPVEYAGLQTLNGLQALS